MATTSQSSNDAQSYSKDHAVSLDARDPLRHFRDEFLIPSQKDLKRKTLAVDDGMYLVYFSLFRVADGHR